MPSYIACFAFFENLIRRQMILTLDDFIFILLVIGVTDQKNIDNNEKVQDEDLLLTFFRQKTTLPPSEQGFT